MPPSEPLPVRAAYVLGGVGVGASQVALNLIVDNPAHFWPSAGFQLFALFWALLLPVGAALALDLLLSRLRSPLPQRIWRASLCACVLLSFLRQVQVAYPGAFASWLGGAPPLVLAPAAFLAVAAAAWRHPEPARRYLTALAILALFSLGRFVVKTELWGPSWASDTKASGSRPTSSAPPLFLLIFDELAMDVLTAADGGIDARDFPSFARLASRSAWFPDATTHHAWTGDSIPSLLSGRVRATRGMPSALDVLAETRDIRLFDNAGAARSVVAADRVGGNIAIEGALRRASHSPAGSLRVLRLALAESPFLNAPLGESRARGLPPLGAWGGGDLLPTDGPREMSMLLSCLSPREARGKVIYWHGGLPHAPYALSADGTPHGRRETRFSPRGETPRHDPAAVLANYREQVRYVDRLLGLILDTLRTEGLEDEAYLVVTSDHGLRTWFGDLEPPEFPERRTSWTPRVPLFLRGPGVAPGRRTVEYQHADLAPTLLDLLGVPCPPGAFEGRSALRGGPPRRKLFLDEERKPCTYDEGAGLWRRLGPGEAPGF
ncbi:MAG TPA: sulfatase-like hydrolase/transferase [Planctomycetota bacterium]